MNKKFRFLSLLMAASLAGGALAGCGSSKDTSATATAAATTAATAAPAKPVTIKLAIWDYAKAPEYKQLIESFQKANPTVTVEPLEISATEYSDKLVIMLAANDESDVLGVKSMPDYSGYITKKQVAPLDDYLTQAKIDLAPYAGINEALKYDGKTYALPYRSDYWVNFFNKDVFDKAGVPYPTHDMTWEQFRDTAKKLTSGSGNNKVWGAYVHTWKSAVVNWAVADKKGTMVDGKYDMFKPYYQLFLGMQNEDKSIMDLGTAKSTSAHYSGQFESGKVGMCLMGSWFIGTLMSDKKAGKHNVNWGMVPVPHMAGVKSGTTFGNVTPFAVNNSSKKKDAAWKFIQFAGTEEGAKIFAKNGVMPAYRTQAVMDIYTGTDGFPTDYKKALDTSSVALEFPADKNGGAIDKALQEEHELIMIGKNNVDQGIASMEKRVKEIRDNSK